ncbi:hypothetical protein ACO1PK_10905 [Alishewanella sp. d11]|uniref:hypothetical protein n=1 Tax=Alishewanella sp. d11 TaxID=3414030 RepID=UPI003BF7B109
MKKSLSVLSLAAITVFFSASSYADKVTVNGITYECSNTCSIDLGPPTTIQDCCAGTVARLRRDAIIIEQPQ